MGVETYGGGLWHTCKAIRKTGHDDTCLTCWTLGFDRDLSIAGRAMVKASDGRIMQKLVKVDRPSMSAEQVSIKRIPC